jgi:G3E family GTPase
VLLAVGRFDPAHTVLQQTKDDDSDSHGHHDANGHASELFDTWSYESDQPFSMEALREMVRKELPASIYRCKGVVLTNDSPEKRYSLQVVGRRVEIMELDDWGERTPQSQLVAIGSSFDERELSRKFDSCLAQVPKSGSKST